MNERFKAIAAEAGISVEYLTNTDQISLIERFAELMIEECCSQIYDRGQYSNGDWAKYRIRTFWNRRMTYRQYYLRQMKLVARAFFIYFKGFVLNRKV